MSKYTFLKVQNHIGSTSIPTLLNILCHGLSMWCLTKADVETLTDALGS